MNARKIATISIFVRIRYSVMFFEPMGRIELPAYSLPWSCSTAELHRQLEPSYIPMFLSLMQTPPEALDSHT